MLHDRFGKLPMAQVLAPAVRYAREGFPVSELIAYYWNRSVPILSEWPGFAEQMTIDGRAPRKGEVWRNENLAGTLERIAREGRDVFYRGDIARSARGCQRRRVRGRAGATRPGWYEPTTG